MQLLGRMRRDILGRIAGSPLPDDMLPLLHVARIVGRRVKGELRICKNKTVKINPVIYIILHFVNLMLKQLRI